MSGYFYITCKTDGKVLDFESGRTTASPVLRTKEKDEEKDTQLWKWDTAGSLINKADNKLVANIKEKNKETGAFVVLGSHSGNPNQKWKVCENSIYSELNGLVMDAADTYVTMKHPGNSKYQKWEFIPEEIQYFYIISENDDKVLDSANNAEGQKLITSQRNGEDTQLWIRDGKCLVNKLGLVADIQDKNEAAGTPVILSSQTGDNNQQWKLDNGQIRSMLNDDLVMDARGSTVEMHHSLKTPSQKWKIDSHTVIKPASGYFYIISEKDGQVLDFGRNSPGQELFVSARSGKYTQLWRWGSKGSRLVNKLGLVVDIKKNRKEVGASVIVWSPTGNLNQRWQQEGCYIRSELNGLVLGILGSGITMQIPSDESTQKWKFVSEEDYKNKYFYDLNGEDGKALDSASDKQGNRLITSEFLRHSSQMWKWDSEGRLVSKSGLVADISVANTNDPNVEAGAQVVLSTSTDTSRQKWEKDDEYIKSKHYPLVMGACESELTTEFDLDIVYSKSEVVVQHPADRLSQKWKFLHVEDRHASWSPYFFIVNEQDGKVLDAAVNEPNEQLITFTALRRGTQLWRWDSEGRLVNKAGLVAGVQQKPRIKSLITQAQTDLLQMMQKANDPVVLGSPIGNSSQVWRVEGHVIKSGLNDLAMDASGSRVTMTSASGDPAQKWEFVPEDLWDDYKLMMENENPLSAAAFWKRVAEYFINAIIGCDMDEYQSKIPDAVAAVNDCARQLDEVSSKTGKVRATGGAAGVVGNVALLGGSVLAPFTAGISSLLSVGGIVTVVAGYMTTLSSGIARRKWDQQDVRAVKDVVGPLFIATMCLQGFLSRYVEKLEDVSKYLETEEGQKISRYAHGTHEKAKERSAAAWNEYKMEYSSITSIQHVKQAQQIKDIIEYVQSDYYIHNGPDLAVTATAPEIPHAGSVLAPTALAAARIIGPLGVFGVAFGVYDTLGGIKDINEQSQLAEEFRRTAQRLKEESDNLIELWNKLFKRTDRRY